MNQTHFRIARFSNPGGTTSWRLDGWTNGIRVRRNFRTREEAAAEKAAQEIRALQATRGFRTVATTLTEDQIREAEALFRRIADKKQPLSFYVDYALTNYLEPERQRFLSEAIADYVATKQNEFNLGYLSNAQLKHIRTDLRRLEVKFEGKRVGEITAADLIAFLDSGGYSLKTYNNYRGIYSTFFKYAFHRGWIAENPILRIPNHRVRRARGMATTFSAAQTRDLMRHFESCDGGRWIPYFALCLFAGIRPGVPDGEITKIRPESVNLDAGLIFITGEMSKVREPRRITIQPNLAAWLRAYPLDRYPVIVGDFKKRREKFKDQFQLTHDVIRHTFISMFVAKFRSIGEAALQAGNSEQIIRKHYLDLKSQTEAEEYFSIYPTPRESAHPLQAAGSPSLELTCTAAG